MIDDAFDEKQPTKCIHIPFPQAKSTPIVDDGFEEKPQTIVHIPPGVDEIYDIFGVPKSNIKCDEVVSSLSKNEIKNLIVEKTNGKYIVGEKNNHLFILNMSA